MPEPIMMRCGDSGKFAYQILNFDETTNDLLPVDLTSKSVKFNLFRQVQQVDGSFTSVQVVSDRTCDILDATEGWVDYELSSLETATHGMYILNLDCDGKTYPRYERQWIHVLPLTTAPITLEDS